MGARLLLGARWCGPATRLSVSAPPVQRETLRWLEQGQALTYEMMAEPWRSPINRLELEDFLVWWDRLVSRQLFLARIFAGLPSRPKW